MDKFKFGTLKKDNEDIKYEYYGNWCLEQYPDFERIVVGPKNNQIDFILEIVRSFELPLAILYVLIVPRVDDNKPGRYQCPFPLKYEDVDEFCSKFKEYFETDGRHHLWICSANSKGIKQLLVYDKHNVIYIYDDINKITEFLEKRNFKESEIRFPFPHTHMYNLENDLYEREIFKYWNWIHFPLREDDD